MARKQWYRWQEVQGFIEWFNDAYRKSLDGARVALIKIGLQKAQAGDFQFWRVMMEKTGEYTPHTKADIKTTTKSQCIELILGGYGEGVDEIVHCCANPNHTHGTIWKKPADFKGTAVIADPSAPDCRKGK